MDFMKQLIVKIKQLIAKIIRIVTTKELLVVLIDDDNDARVLGWHRFSSIPQPGDSIWWNVDGTSVILTVHNRCFCESSSLVMVPTLSVERKKENGVRVTRKPPVVRRNRRSARFSASGFQRSRTTSKRRGFRSRVRSAN